MNEREALVARVKRTLSDFSGDVPDGTDVWRFSGYQPPRDEFPVPELVLFVLRDVMGFPGRAPVRKSAGPYTACSGASR